MRRCFDISAYLVIGPENVKSGRVAEVIRAAVAGGFTCVQLRSKAASAREMIALAAEAAGVIRELGKNNTTALLIDDRLDVVLAAREQGTKVDGLHVGQKDIPPAVCRRYLGNEAVIGLSAPAAELLSCLASPEREYVDYFGAAPYHETGTKPDCERGADGKVILTPDECLREMTAKSPLPVVVGGGVKPEDLPAIKRTGAAGFFVVTAITEAADVYAAARNMCRLWRES